MRNRYRQSGVLNGPLSDGEVMALVRYWQNVSPFDMPPKCELRCDVGDMLSERFGGEYSERDVTAGYQQVRAAIRDVDAGRLSEDYAQVRVA